MKKGKSMKPVKKLIPATTIEFCCECDQHITDRLGNWVCRAKKHRNIPSYPTIPSWCPLEDAPEWKDKPDSDGDWKYIFKDGEIKSGFVSLEYDNFVVPRETGCTIYKLYELKGKWVKATLPEEEK